MRIKTFLCTVLICSFLISVLQGQEEQGPIGLRFGALKEEVDRRLIYFFPIIIGNHYDGFSPSLVLHNYSHPGQRLHWALIGSYGLSSDEFRYSGGLTYDLPIKQTINQKFVLDASIDQYGFREIISIPEVLGYQRFQAGVTFLSKKDSSNTLDLKAFWQGILLQTDRPTFDGMGQFAGLTTDDFFINRLGLEITNKRQLNPFRFNTLLEHQSYEDVFARDQSYIKLALTFQGKSFFTDKDAFRYRIFAGFFLHNTARNDGIIQPGAFGLVPLGSFDYSFSHYYGGRSESQGFLSQQLGTWDGGFKTPISPAQPIGRSNNYAWAINLSSDVPIVPVWLPFRPYLDLGYADNATPLGANLQFGDQFIWNLGISLEYLDGRFGIYFPLFGSDNLMDPLAEKGNYFKRIGFRLSLKELLPHKVIKENIKF